MCSSAVPQPVTVRVPAKINLHLAVGPLRSDGYHDLVDGLPRREPVRRGDGRGDRAPGRRGARRGRRRGADRRHEPRVAGRRAGRRARRPRFRTSGSCCARASRSPAAWPAAARTPRARSSALSALWKLDLTRDELSRMAARARQRRHLRPARRHRAGHRARRDDRPGAVAPPAALGDRAAPRRSRDAGGLPASWTACAASSATGARARGAAGRAGARGRRGRRPAPARAAAWATTCRRPR